MHPRCDECERNRQRNGRRVEIISTGVDENVQGLGSDPYGSLNTPGLRVPAFPTVGPEHRYLFQLAQFNIPEGNRARVRGFRHGYSLGIAQENPQAGTRRVIEQWVESPFFQMNNGNVSWHMRIMQQEEPQVPHPWQGPQQPPLRNFPFRTSDTPGLLYQAATFPAGVPIFYTTLTAYTPPNAGQPWGRPLTGELGTFYDLKTDWRTPDAWHALDIPLDGPARVVFYASVQQVDLATIVRITRPDPFIFQNGLSPEEQFLLNFPNAIIWRVAGGLIVELDCKE